MEAPPPGELDGRSIVSMFTEGEALPERPIFWEYGSQLAVRDGKWKLVLNGKLGSDRMQLDDVHLSDLEANPGKRINLKNHYRVSLGAWSTARGSGTLK